MKKTQKDKRLKKASEIRTAEKDKSFDDFDWKALVVGSELQDLSVTVLNKYLSHFEILSKFDIFD